MIKIKKKFKPSIILVLGIVLFFITVGYYLFYWIPENKANLSSRYLRVLAMMSDQFEKRGEIFPKEIEVETDIDEMNNDLNDSSLLKNTRKFLFDNLKSFFPNEIPEKFYTPIESQLTFQFYNEIQDAFKFPIIIYPTKNGIKKEPFHIQILIKVVDFIRELSYGEEFDDVLIIDDKLEVVYTRNHYQNKGVNNSFKAFNVDAFFNQATGLDSNNKKKEEFGFSQILNIKIGESKFLAFIQPIPLSFLDNSFHNGNKNRWQMVGIISTEEFMKRCKEIPINLLLFLLLFFILILLAYPFIKFLFIDPWERIRLRDVCFFSLSIAIGLPVIIFSIHTFLNQKIQNNYLHNDLKNIATQMNDKFLDEIQSACYQLIYIKDNMNEYLIPQNTERVEESKKNLLQLLLNKLGGLWYQYFDMVFILDKNGNQSYKGIADDSSITFKNVSNRKYFQQIQKSEYWYINNNQSIVLEPVYSLSTARFELNLAIPFSTEKYSAAVLSFRPLSVINPLLPNDFGFAIIDNSGRVIFHRDRSLNLSENFFSECIDSKRIKSAMLNHVEDFINSSQYQVKRRDIFVKPMKDIPLTIIVFRDKSLSDSRNLEILFQGFFKYLGYLGPLLFLLLIYLIILYIYKKTSAIQRKPLAYKINYIWPNKKLRLKYMFLAFFNFICFISFIMDLYLLETPYRPLLYLPLINILMTFSVIRIASNEISDAEVIIKINKNNLFSNKLFAILSGILIMTLTTYILFFILYFGISILSKILIIFSYIIAFFIITYLIKDKENRKIKNSLFYRNAHQLLIYSFILLVFVHPSLMFNKISLDINKIVDIKYHQVKFVDEYVKWKERYRIEYESQDRVLRDYYQSNSCRLFAKKRGIYSMESYNTSIIENEVFKIQLDKSTKNGKNITHLNSTKPFFISVMPSENNTTKIQIDNNNSNQIESKMQSNEKIELPRIQYGDIKNLKKETNLINSTFLSNISKKIPFDSSYSENVKFLYNNNSDQSDSTLEWSKIVLENRNGNNEPEEVLMKYNYKPNLEINKDNNEVEPIYIATASIKNDKDIGRWKWTGIICIIFLVFILFYIVHFIWKIIFLGGLGIQPEEDLYFDNTNKSIQNLKGKFFIFGNPPEKIHELADSDESIALISLKNAKFKTICKSLSTDKKKIIISHFDYMRQSVNVNLEKLSLLEQLVYGCNATVIIYSQFEPIENFILSTDITNNLESSVEFEKKKVSILESWQRVLKQFEFRYVKTHDTSFPKINTLEYSGEVSENAAKFIVSECTVLENLKMLPYHIWNDHILASKDKNVGDHIVRDLILEHTIHEYELIWRNSTKEEKLVMLQLAHEGLLNYKNREIIRKLLKRKLIILSPIRLFNTTFKDYINSVEDLDAILKYESTLKNNNWNNVRKPFIILIISLMLFIVLLEPNLLNTWLALIPALGSIIPLLLKLFDQILGYSVKLK